MPLTHLVILGVCAMLMLAAGLRHRQLLDSARAFWSAPGSPITLAVFRIVLFGTLFLVVNLPATVWYSRMPVELRIAPFGMHKILPHLPITPTLASTAANLLLFFCAMAMIGLFTRVSAWLAVVLGLYVLGIPQFYGKVNHMTHHLIWFSALMAASPCADVLSCDAVRAAWRRADGGDTAPPAPSQNYALPLRFVWLLMGVLYFFPGFWKLWHVGFSWALSDNMKFQMYAKWVELDGWTPAFRIDQHPWLCKLTGAGTMAFEVSFLFFVFSTRLRPWLIGGGLLFHNLTNLFMRIPFFTLQAMYVSLVDWARVFHHLGQRLYPAQMCVAYGGNCKNCRRLIASLRAFDIFGRVTYVNGASEAALVPKELQGMGAAAWMGPIDCTRPPQRLTSFAAYREFATRLPLLWPALLFLYLWPAGATRLCRRIVTLCGCQTQPQTAQEAQWRAATVNPERQGRRGAGILIVGVILLFANMTFGLRRISEAWPFACYPTFDFRAGAEGHRLAIAVQTEEGKIIYLNENALNPHLTTERARGLQETVMSTTDPEERRIQFLGLWHLWQQNHPELRAARSVRFYRDTLTTVPEQRGRNPLRRELLFVLPLSRAPGSALQGMKAS